MALFALPRTRRLRFREMADADLPALSEIFADVQARRIYPDMDRAESLQAWIDWNRQNYARFGFGLWMLIKADDGAAIGDCGITYQPVEGREELEVGYHIAAAHRRQGYALEAARACLAFAFAHTDAALVCSKVAPDNVASRAVASQLHRHRREYLNERGLRRFLFYTQRDDLA